MIDAGRRARDQTDLILVYTKGGWIDVDGEIVWWHWASKFAVHYVCLRLSFTGSLSDVCTSLASCEAVTVLSACIENVSNSAIVGIGNVVLR